MNNANLPNRNNRKSGLISQTDHDRKLAGIEENFKTILSTKYDSIVKLFDEEAEDNKLGVPGLLVVKENTEIETPAVEEITGGEPNDQNNNHEETDQQE